jgi:hypothetical protein
MKRFNSFLALLIILLLPLQGLAASTNSLCHQFSSAKYSAQSHEESHACHQKIKLTHGNHQKEKNHCISACGHLNITAINVSIAVDFAEFTESYGASSSKNYHSISPFKALRPPIQIS